MRYCFLIILPIFQYPLFVCCWIFFFLVRDYFFMILLIFGLCMVLCLVDCHHQYLFYLLSYNHDSFQSCRKNQLAQCLLSADLHGALVLGNLVKVAAPILHYLWITNKNFRSSAFSSSSSVFFWRTVSMNDHFTYNWPENHLNHRKFISWMDTSLLAQISYQITCEVWGSLWS